jgi:hypothetical protein
MRIIVCAICILAAFNNTYAKEWRGIVPLHSTRADVARILGTPPPEKNHPDAVVYKQEHEDVLVRYSTGECIEKWNVPRDTVIFIHVFPKQRPKFSELRLDVSKYRKYLEPELPEYSNYDNEEEGFQVNVDGEGLVELFVYYWKAKDTNMRCPDSAKPNKSINRTRN